MTSSTKDYNVYDAFLLSHRDLEAKENVMIKEALIYLYDEGYITEEERQSGKSKRLCDIRCYARPGYYSIYLIFDNYEWLISLDIDIYNHQVSNLNVQVSAFGDTK